MKLDIDALTVSDADEGRENAAAGGFPASPAVSRWTFTAPDQLEKQLRGAAAVGHPFKTLSAGDKSAALDLANEARKQVES